MPERVDQIVAVDVVAHLFALVAEDGIGLAGDGAFHQIGEETVQLARRNGPARSGSRRGSKPVFMPK